VGCPRAIELGLGELGFSDHNRCPGISMTGACSARTCRGISTKWKKPARPSSIAHSSRSGATT
jgi:hypothetical protein